MSAGHYCAEARGIFTSLDIPRRVAQIDLSLAVVTEMSGELGIASRAYRDPASDGRLSRRDRARAMLWVGTALSKGGEHTAAITAMTCGVNVTPLQTVRLSTAQAHILMSDKTTSTEGLALLDQAAHLAGANGLSHQLRSIQSIRQVATGRPVRA